MSTAYIGIGSNLGNREENCFHAIELLEKKGIKIKKKSSLYETEPWGIKQQPIFLNMAVEIETELEPDKLLRLLKDIEKKLGRKNTLKWGPRIIDLDILIFDDIILNKKDLKIPHPLMHKRGFVLKPLNEIAPKINHPLLNRSIAELVQQFYRK
ncbi:MAG: 2-amino-4-hydroxy-6-hydroxymethyldihydropteridine diphosphokinase [Nitrospirae bacterium]|nr:2-amino-4-hydroxy-6-hydroxymethyldihydropteridine diphosphokinase [Nitrospirota bacterium]